MAKQPKPKAPKVPQPVEALVLNALKTAATKPGASWTAATSSGLFNTKEENHLAAIAECTRVERPLLKQDGKGGVLTPDGFLRLLEGTPVKQVGKLAVACAAGMDGAARGMILGVLDGQASGPNAERAAAFADALRDEEGRQAADRARQAEEAKFARYRQAVVSHRATEARLLRELALCRAEIGIAEQAARAFEAALAAAGKATADGTTGGSSQQGTPPPAPEPKTDEQKEFRRYTADRLAAAWRDAWNEGKTEGRDYLETAIWNIRGMKVIGEVGQKVAFDGRIHESDASVFSDASVRVVRPGWLLQVDDEDYVALKAAVTPV